MLLFCGVSTLLVSRSFFAIARIYSSYILSKPLFVYLFFPLLARFFWGVLVYFGELLFVLSYSFWTFLSALPCEFWSFSICSFLRIFGCLMKRKTLYQHSVSNVDAGCCKNDSIELVISISRGIRRARVEFRCRRVPLRCCSARGRCWDRS